MSRTVLLFPGQGSQEPGMGRDLAEADREIMQLWKTAERISGLALREIYWDGDESLMSDTRGLQPALTVVNLGLWQKLSARVRPMAAAGHSLGEFSAFAAAGVLSVEAVLELVSLRGRLMSEADPQGKGRMAAVLRLSLPQVEACVAEAGGESGESIVVANYNTPGQFVVSGGAAAMTILQEKVRAAKGRAMLLPVAGAFHSPLMAEAAVEFARAVDCMSKSAWSKARFPVYCNVHPQPEVEPEALKGLMRKQMTSPVQWMDSIVRLWDDGARQFVECGPKGVLGKMVDPILTAHAPAAKEAADKESADKEPAWQVASVGNMRQLQEF